MSIRNITVKVSSNAVLFAARETSGFMVNKLSFQTPLEVDDLAKCEAFAESLENWLHDLHIEAQPEHVKEMRFVLFTSTGAIAENRQWFYQVLQHNDYRYKLAYTAGSRTTSLEIFSEASS